MIFYAPKNFKSGHYYFNKYDIVDLFVLIPCVVVGAIICIVGIYTILKYETILYAIILGTVGGLFMLIGFLLTLNMYIYHNILGKIRCIISYYNRQRKFKWLGYDYHNYDNE